MFAVVRTGGKQYRVAPGDKIVVEKLAGNAGDRIDLSDILMAGEGGNMKSLEGLTVGAEIIAQAKADKVVVFKKRRRHNYRRKAGHRQQHTILRILSIGDVKAENAPAKTAAAAPGAKVSDAAAEKPVKAPKPAKAAAPAPESSTTDAVPAKAPAKKAAKAAKNPE